MEASGQLLCPQAKVLTKNEQKVGWLQNQPAHFARGTKKWFYSVCVHNTHWHTRQNSLYYKLLISLQRFGRCDSFHNKNLEDTKRDYYSRTMAESSKLKQAGLTKWILSMYYDDNYECLKSDPHDDRKIYVSTLLKCSSCQVISSMLGKNGVCFLLSKPTNA
jgi:hypothetical protein